MSNEAVIVIYVQNCFLPGGSLATGNSRNATIPSEMLGKSIANFINKKHPNAQVFVSKDFHTPGHSSFVSAEQRAQGMLNFPSAAARGEYAKGIAVGRYAGRKFTKSRSWGQRDERMNQKLWPEHCVQGTPGADVAESFTNELQKNIKTVTILKGDTPDIDSYSVVADALGTPTPHDEAGKPFLEILRGSNLDTIYLTGIARDVCVFWSAMDILNFWILPQYKAGGEVVKLVFMYDLTRPVSPIPGAPYTDITPEQLKTKVQELLARMNLKPEVYDEVFEIRMGEYLEGKGASTTLPADFARIAPNLFSGGRRSRKQHRHTRRCA
jgi:nicotinamidase-related amidase